MHELFTVPQKVYSWLISKENANYNLARFSDFEEFKNYRDQGSCIGFFGVRIIQHDPFFENRGGYPHRSLYFTQNKVHTEEMQNHMAKGITDLVTGTAICHNHNVTVNFYMPGIKRKEEYVVEQYAYEEELCDSVQIRVENNKIIDGDEVVSKLETTSRKFLQSTGIYEINIYDYAEKEFKNPHSSFRKRTFS